MCIKHPLPLKSEVKSSELSEMTPQRFDSLYLAGITKYANNEITDDELDLIFREKNIVDKDFLFFYFAYCYNLSMIYHLLTTDVYVNFLRKKGDRTSTYQRTLSAMIISGEYERSDIKKILELFFKNEIPIGGTWSFDLPQRFHCSMSWVNRNKMYETLDEFNALINSCARCMYVHLLGKNVKTDNMDLVPLCDEIKSQLRSDCTNNWYNPETYFLVGNKK